MALYSLLSVLFLIGGIGVFRVAKRFESAQAKYHWRKFIAYIILVFGQLALISSGLYSWFAITVIGIGLYEIESVGKSGKAILVGAAMLLLAGVGFWLFFAWAPIKWQQFLFMTVIIFDGFCQIFGQLFGKTKLFPITSPGKTLEGLAGGTLMVALMSCFLGFILQIDFWPAVTCGMAVSLFSLVGDISASYYKRLAGVKDFSRLIPGHGGVLDRFDSLIVAGFGMFLLMLIPFSEVEIWYDIAYVFVFLLLFLLAEIGYHTIKLKVEVTRKFVHILSGLIVLSFPMLLESWVSVLFLCIGFIAILVLSKHFGKLPSINSVDRKTNGSFMFPVSVFLCFLFFIYTGDSRDFYLPMLILAICDPVAALCGKRWPFGKYTIGNASKTITGSIAFFLACMLILVCANGNISTESFVLLLTIALLATLVEAVSGNGWDNFAIPVSVTVLLSIIGT